jgi:[ribosomal protein S5]-alanine N-acetyltransferase
MTAKLGRFLIRDINPWEGPGVFALTGDRNVMRYMGFPVHTTLDDATKLIQTYRASPSKYQAVCLDGDPTDVLGIVGMEVRGHQATMTIMFRRDWKARGAGREFSVPFVTWIFTHPQIYRVSAYCHVDNIAVQRVLERMGAEREGRLRRFEYFPNVASEPQDVYLYAIVR